MSDLLGTPEDVLTVHNALTKNAMENWGDVTMADTAVYTRPGKTRDGEQPDSWLISANFEGFGGCMIRRADGTWWYREWMSEGEDKPMKGVEEALANAEIWFTG